MVPNLRWWLIFVCSAAGLAFAAASGHIAAMWRIDAYKVSFVTLATYFLVTVFIGLTQARGAIGTLTAGSSTALVNTLVGLIGAAR